MKEADARATFWADIRANPSAQLPKFAFADWLEESGDESCAHALRWCAARGKHPHVSPKGRIAYWQRQAMGAMGAFNLPGPVFDMLREGKRRSNVIKVYGSLRAAFEALAAALARLKTLWDVPVAGKGAGR